MPFLIARLADDDVDMYDLIDHVQSLPHEEQLAPERDFAIPDPNAHLPTGNRFDVVDHQRAQSFRARFHPQRLEFDIESRRRIAHEHQEGDDGSCATCSVVYPCPTLLFLTWIYADHPGYDPQWQYSVLVDADDAVAIARERLDWIDGDRAVADLLGQLPEDEIAFQLGLSLTRVRRTRAYLHSLGGVLPETPEEIIARCVVSGGDREALLDRLKTWPYTFGTQAPAPVEGGTTGSWDDIEDALFDGWLEREEYDAIRAAVAATSQPPW